MPGVENGGGYPMQSNKRERGAASWTRGFTALSVLLVLEVALTARPSEAAPFAYLTDSLSTVLVLDTATNAWVTMVNVGQNPASIAVTPDGKIRLCDEYRLQYCLGDR